MIKRIMGISGFIMTAFGMCSLDSEGTGYNIAVTITAFGILFLFCWSSKGRK
jgi:hypothetical protein